MKTFSDTTFSTEVENASGPVVVDFWAPWCGPCTMVTPLLETLKEKYPSVTFGKLNVDDNPETSQKYKIRSIPSLLFFKKGELEGTMIGVRTIEEYEVFIHRILS